MKRSKQFKTGDKVFAKVKGYPHWPAKVTAVNGKKFTVEFYGTGEIGSIKAEDLFYYLKHKHNLIKPSKRKDYNEALEEIEKAVQLDGTDGNEYPEDSLTDVSVASTVSEMKPPKRKRSTSEKSDSGHSPKKVDRKKGSVDSESPTKPDIEMDTGDLNRNSPDVSKESADNKKSSDDKTESPDTDKKSSVVSNLSTSTNIESSDLIKDAAARRREEIQENIRNRKQIALEREVECVTGNEEVPPKFVETADTEPETESEGSDEDVVEVPNVQQTPAKKSINVTKLVSEEVLKSYIAYADHLKAYDKIFMSKYQEPREDYLKHVFPVKLPSGKYVALKLHKEWPLSFRNEYDRALYDAEVAKRLILLKKDLESGKSTPESLTDALLEDFTMDDKEIEIALHTDLLKSNKAKTERLRAEHQMVELDAKIKECLGLDKADPKEAIDHLFDMSGMEFDKFMLIKHPHVVEMVRRLRKYVGNVEEWNLTGDALDTFIYDADLIRLKADEIWSNFKQTVPVPKKSPSFWDGFNMVVDKFRKETKELHEDQIVLVRSEPFSRQFFMDQYEDNPTKPVKLVPQVEEVDKEEAAPPQEIIDLDEEVGPSV